MMDALLIAGKRLADALRAENEALAKLDLSSAAKIAESKIAATNSCSVTLSGRIPMRRSD